ncbi:MAG TPA: hypothetical protein VID25_06960 [Candidatus Limnocylindrales bacterium]
MNRRALGRGRLTVGIGAMLAVVGCFLPWFTVGGGAGQLPATSANGFDGAGVVVFVAAVALLALIALPYAAGDQPLTIDRAATYVVATAVGLIGLLARLAQLLLQLSDLGPLWPMRAPGLWIAAVGIIIVVWGTAEVLRERGSF